MSEQEPRKGDKVRFKDGKFGILYHDDQGKKKFRCGCCGAPVNKDGKVLVTMTDMYFNHTDERKRVVELRNLIHVGFINY